MALVHLRFNFLAYYFMVFHFLVCIFHHGTPSKCNSVFDTDPESLTVYEGEDAFFTCTAFNFNNATDTLIWKVNPSQYYSVISEFYDPWTRRMTSNLTVFRVQRNSQVQQCVAFILGSNYMPKTCYSEVANLNAYYFPREDELLCEPQHPGVVEEGQILMIRCQVLNGNPEVHLAWKLEGDSNATLVTSHVNGSVKVLTQNLEMVHTLHNQSIVCEVTSPEAFPDRKLSVHIGPFITYHKPHLTLSPPGLIIQPGEPNQHLICNGKAYPAITNMTWSCLPSNIIQGCDLLQNQNHILNVTVSPNNTCFLHDENCSVTIACFATNSLGTSMVETKVRILPYFIPEEGDVESNLRMGLALVNASLVGLGEWDVYCMCTINSTLSLAEGSTVEWLFNNTSIPANEDVVAKTRYERKYTVNIKSLKLSNIKKKVACILISREGQVIMEVNQSISELITNAQDTAEDILINRKGTTESLYTPFTHIIEVTKSITNQNHISTNKEGSDSMDLQEGSGNKHVIVIATTAAVGGLLLAVCIFAVITMVLYRHFRHVSSAMCSQDQTIKKETIQLEDKHQTESKALSVGEEEHVYQDLTEIRHELEAKQTMTYRDSVSSYSCTSYESNNIYYCSMSGNSHNSTASSNDYFYGSYKSDKSDISVKNQENITESTADDTYGNQSIIEKQIRKPTSSRINRSKWENVTFNEAPPLPLKKPTDKAF